MKLDPCVIPCPKINSKWIRNLKGLYKKYPLEWLIYVCRKTVIEDFSTILPNDPYARAWMISFSLFPGKSVLLQMCTLMLKESKWHSRPLTAGKWQRWDLNQGSQTPESTPNPASAVTLLYSLPTRAAFLDRTGAIGRGVPAGPRGECGTNPSPEVPSAGCGKSQGRTLLALR
ncbi:uncharacterized protein LOC144614867 [Panthera onca]